MTIICQQHWVSLYLVLCKQWHKLDQSGANNVAALGILHISYCFNNDTNWDDIVSTKCQYWDSPYRALCQHGNKLGKIVKIICQ